MPAALEDVILGKLICYRDGGSDKRDGGSDKHLRDIASILKISGQDVDRSYVAQFAAQLGVANLWQTVLKRVDEG